MSDLEYFVYDHRKKTHTANVHPVNGRTYSNKDAARRARDRLDLKHGSYIHSVGQRSIAKNESYEFVNQVIDEEIDKIIEEELSEYLEERCQKGYKTHHKRKTKKMFGKNYRNCVKANEETSVEEKKDGKGASSKGYSLRDWFKGGGWKQTGGKHDGKPCAKQPGQKTKPYCRDADDRAKLSKKERDKRAAKKRREDPNPNRSGKAKNVKQKK